MNIKKISAMSLAILMTSGFFTGITSANNNETVICLDAGQYIDQPGKRSPDGYQEVTYTFAMVKKVKAEIEKQRPNVKVIESNADGTNTGIGQRGKYALANKADFMLSLHMDSVGGDWQNRASGFHFISQTDSPKEVKADIKKMIEEYASGTEIPKHRSTGFDDNRPDLTMLECVSPANSEDYNYVPSTLLEMSFMDHEVLAFKLRDEEYQNKVAKVIADTLIKNVIDNPYYANDQAWEKPISNVVDNTGNIIENKTDESNNGENVAGQIIGNAIAEDIIEHTMTPEENTEQEAEESSNDVEDNKPKSLLAGIFSKNDKDDENVKEVETEKVEDVVKEDIEEKSKKIKNVEDIKDNSQKTIKEKQVSLNKEKDTQIKEFKQKINQGKIKEAENQIYNNIKEINKLIDELNLMSTKMKQDTKEIEERLKN